jgi:predicted CXXCH cytochrome family protein
MPARRIGGLLLAFALAPGVPALAAAPAKSPPPSTARPASWKLAPLPAAEAVASHMPYEAGDCSICHARADPKSPGPVAKRGPELCVDCHDELQHITARAFKHPPAIDACTNCHNPHNGRQPKMLHADVRTLCGTCHPKVASAAEAAKVKHGALEVERACANCHNPHGSDVEKLLLQLPFDLCLTCHGKDDVQDRTGKKLMNMKKYLAENKVWHPPVAGKDCSVCHEVHGGDNFRLLLAEFPPTFYAPFDPKNYALCFTCHDEQMVTAAETTTLTGFRNGARNLHFVHVNRPDRGRTCRACHEVHASNQERIIRETVPYGSKGYLLALHYSKTPTGGQCTRTCHATRAYDNKTPVPAAK